jgi:hypothetical protein
VSVNFEPLSLKPSRIQDDYETQTIKSGIPTIAIAQQQSSQEFFSEDKLHDTSRFAQALEGWVLMFGRYWHVCAFP